MLARQSPYDASFSWEEYNATGGRAMRKRVTADGLTVNAIAGNHVVLLGLDLTDARRAGCLGFAIRREDIPKATPSGCGACRRSPRPTPAWMSAKP
jgi:hypothetical protein